MRACEDMCVFECACKKIDTLLMFAYLLSLVCFAQKNLSGMKKTEEERERTDERAKYLSLLHPLNFKLFQLSSSVSFSFFNYYRRERKNRFLSY